MKRNKYFLIFAFLIVLLQILSYVVVVSNVGIVNNRLFFGLMGNNAIAISASIIVLVSLFFLARDKKVFWLAYVVLAAGSISNMFSRLIYGGVIDYVNLYKFPSFNLEDVFIVLGLFYFAVKFLSSGDQKT